MIESDAAEQETVERRMNQENLRNIYDPIKPLQTADLLTQRNEALVGEGESKTHDAN